MLWTIIDGQLFFVRQNLIAVLAQYTDVKEGQ